MDEESQRWGRGEGLRRDVRVGLSVYRLDLVLLIYSFFPFLSRHVSVHGLSPSSGLFLAFSV